MPSGKEYQMSVSIQNVSVLSITLEVTGTSPLLQNKFNQKTIEQMLRKHMGLPTNRENKIPAEVIENATVRNADGVVCMLPVCFKKAMLTASTQIKGLKKTQLRSAIFIEGKSIVIDYSRMCPQMDMVRTSGMNKQPDIRFRPRFEDWKACLTISFPENIPPQTVVDLLNRSGTVGIGEWRPEKDGTFGTYNVTRCVTDAEEIKAINKRNASPVPSLTIPDWALNVEMSAEIAQLIANGSETNTEEKE